MVEYTKVNVRLSDSQLKPQELLLTTRQKTKIRNAFDNNTSTHIKFSKAQINKIIHSGRVLGRLHGPLLKTGLSLIKNVTNH